MPIINSHVKPFKATAYKNGSFVEVSDADLKGKWSVVFFYPADFTFVCPTELETWLTTTKSSKTRRGNLQRID